MAFFIAISVLTLVGIISPVEMLSGFANEQLVVIIMLLFIGNVLRRTSLLLYIFDSIFRGATTYRGFMARMMLFIASASTFLNNTPLVAMILPYVHSWGIKKDVAPSKLLIPLSYASILGGSATLIGTSTNLLVNSMAIENGLPSLALFDFSLVGGTMMFIGILYLIIVGPHILPEHTEYLQQIVDQPKKYFIETKVKPNSPLVNKDIEGANLRNLKNLFLVEIIRNEEQIFPISPDEMIKAEDTLIFTGNTAAISDIQNPAFGLSFPKDNAIKVDPSTNIAELIVAPNASISNRVIRETAFRGRYDAAIVAVHRNGERLSGKIGNIRLKSGDVLMVLTGSDFFKRVVSNNDFYIISKTTDFTNINFAKGLFVLIGILIAIVLAALGIMSLFKSLLILCGGILLFNIIPRNELLRNIDFNLVFLIGMGLALGKALVNSGAAQLIADGLLNISEPLGTIGLLGILFLTTNFLSAYMINKAAVAITLPIAATLAISLDVPHQPLILAVAFGACASFLTPISFQTNLMVYGPGGYSFKDFLKIGFPLVLIYMLVCIGLLSFQYNLW